MFNGNTGMFIADTQGLVINVKSFGAQGDGSTDDTAALASALAQAAITGGIVYFPSGTYISGPQSLYAHVYCIGAGVGASIIQLKSGSNADLFSGQTSYINLAAAAGSGPVGNLYQFGFSNLTLDGNEAGQTSGPCYPLRFYGYTWRLQDIEILHGYSGNGLCDWNGPGTPSDGMEAFISQLKCHDCGGMNWEMGGPHDSQFVQSFFFTSGSHGLHFAPNANGILLTECHAYGEGANSVALLAESVVLCENCLMEGASDTQVVFLASGSTYNGGQIFPGSAPANVIGVQLGQLAGATPYPGQILQNGGLTTSAQATNCHINTHITGCLSGAINFLNESDNIIIVTIQQANGNALVAGRGPFTTDFVIWHVSGGIGPDNTMNTASAVQLGSGGNPNSSLFRISEGNYYGAETDLMRFNSAAGGGMSLGNGASLQAYSDNFVTQKYELHADTGNAEFVGGLQLGSKSRIYSGLDVPPTTLGVSGDYYFRQDAPGTALERIYINNGGTWQGIV